ncbi:MAG TPA: hypothetical protein VFX35_01370 [Solirubrobacterales bacterium]|nr:hypothetical protein [Solirubrobacterales bacterium]
MCEGVADRVPGLGALPKFLLEEARDVRGAVLADHDVAGLPGRPPAQVGVELGEELADAATIRQRPVPAEVVQRDRGEGGREVVPDLPVY